MQWNQLGAHNHMARKRSIPSKLVMEVKRLFCKDNAAFAARLITGFLGFVLTNISLIDIASLSLTQLFLVILLVIFFLIFLLPIYKRYRYNRRIIDELLSTDRPAYAYCTYMANKQKGSKMIQNHFDICKIAIEYLINCQNVTELEKCDLTVKYLFENAKARKKTNKINFLSLSTHKQPDDFAPMCQIIRTQKSYSNEPSEMKSDRSPNTNSCLQLWKKFLTGEEIEQDETVSWEIEMKYTDPYKLSSSNRFLIDLSNYCDGEIEELHIRVTINWGNGKREIPRDLLLYRKYSDSLSETEEPVLALKKYNSTSWTAPGLNNPDSYWISRKGDKLLPGSVYILEIPGIPKDKSGYTNMKSNIKA